LVFVFEGLVLPEKAKMIRSTSLIRNVVLAAFPVCLVAAATTSRAHAQFPQPRLGADHPLVVLITSEIAPNRWERAGGRGNIQFTDNWGLIFVTQTREVHHEVEDLLAVVRQARVQPPPQAPAGDAAGGNQQNQQDAGSLVLQSASVSAARQQLDEEFVTTTSLQFNNTPLSEVAEMIGQQHGIEVVLDTEALEAAGVSADMPVTRSLNNVSLRTGLWLLLEGLDLSYVIRDATVHITTRDEAESLITRVYNVQDLLR
jgi:hypothetical protein